jgi:hypothetical protein
MLPGYAVYDATKGAVEQFTHILSKEFGPRGITVNAVSPGATETETYRAGKSRQFLASLEAMSAFGRPGRPDEIAAVVAFLASDAARCVTAQNIRVNGGTALGAMSHAKCRTRLPGCPRRSPRPARGTHAVMESQRSTPKRRVRALLSGDLRAVDRPRQSRLRRSTSRIFIHRRA